MAATVEGFPGYRFEVTEPDAPRLFAPDGTLVARFGPGWSEKDVQRAAAEHAEDTLETHYSCLGRMKP